VPEEGPLTTAAEQWAWLFRQGSRLQVLPKELSAAQREAMVLADRTSWTASEQEAYRKANDEIEQARQLAREAEARREADGLREGKEDGLREGNAAGLRAAITDLCEVLGVEVTDERRAHLAALDLPGLEALRSELKAMKAWLAG
jgi:flagellar biosynthesis/type III secretory pathway protein FliH